jgi:hypothetical protein
MNGFRPEIEWIESCHEAIHLKLKSVGLGDFHGVSDNNQWERQRQASESDIVAALTRQLSLQPNPKLLGLHDNKKRTNDDSESGDEDNECPANDARRYGHKKTIHVEDMLSNRGAVTVRQRENL